MPTETVTQAAGSDSSVLLLGIVLVISVLGLVTAYALAKWVLSKSTGSEAMQKISNAIKEGAEAFLRTMNRTIILLAGGSAVVLFIGYAFVRGYEQFDPIKAGDPSAFGAGIPLAGWITFSFVLGAVCSMIAGYVGMWVSIRANIRTATAAMTSLNDALRIALRGGAVSGLLVVSMSLLGVGGLYALVSLISSPADPKEAAEFATKIPLLIVGYGFGASFVALFAQLGGGIYTKAADVGADLVGKVEAGIPEDDPRNPAVIADLVGDNVGDCAGRGADLFESTAAENIGAMILGAALAKAAGEHNPSIFFSMGVVGVMMFPLIARAFGIIASIVGIVMVKMDKEEKMDPMQALNRGYYIAVVLAMIGFGICTYWLLNPTSADTVLAASIKNAWLYFFACGIIGVAMSVAFVYITQYYTEYKYRPVKLIANASVTGPATNIIAGIGVGLECVAVPVLVMGASLLSSYYIGKAGLPGLPEAGLFGTAVATMGMLSTAAFILAMDTFGPITDNAGGIVEMSEQPESVRVKTDRLDSVGNTTKALTKGYAIGSAALAAFLLFQAYMEEVINYAGMNAPGAVEKITTFPVDLSKPAVFVAGLIGAALVFLFSALAIRAVGSAAEAIIAEVRRQYKDLKRENDMIVFPKDFQPDYGACVDIVTRAALRKMVAPGILAVSTPIVVGILFKILFKPEVADLHNKFGALIGAESVGGLLMVGTIVGIVMALFLNNSGGAWDNAKKYIETGALGGKYITVNGKKVKNPTHGAAVVGDTVGDPFKDTAGPSLHVLIKLLATVTLVLAPLFI